MRVAFTTLGCKVNQYDTATMETLLRAQGCEVVPFEAGADVYGEAEQPKRRLRTHYQSLCRSKLPPTDGDP